jgi:hypothetical protein
MTMVRERAEPAAAAAADLRLVHVGWVHDLVVRCGLERAGEPRLGRRIALVVLATWVPSLLLAVAQGVAVGPRVGLPFLASFDPPAKLLVALPFMLLAEQVMAGRFASAARQFLTADVIADRDRSRYATLCRRASRLSEAYLTDIILLVISLALTLPALAALERIAVPDWRALRGGGEGITAAGWWYFVVCMSLFRFVLLRWFWRFSVWAWFLRRVAKLDLALVPTHADLAGGLGFLSRTQAGFGLVVVGVCAVLSADIAGLVVHGGVPLDRFKVMIGTLIGFFVLASSAPLLAFSAQLVRARYRATLEYGAIVSQHHRAFDAKWVRGRPGDGGGLLGDPDASSLADVPSGFENVMQMHVVPLTRADALLLVLAAALPFVPLLFTKLSLEQFVSRLAQLLL